MDNWVLVVEDDEDNRDLMVEVLTGAGYACRAVSGGLEALGMLRRDVPCLVLADLILHDMDGRDLLLRARSELSTVPAFVFVTGAHPSKLEDVSGAILPKPIDIDQLLTVVAHHCGLPKLGDLPTSA